MFLDTSGFFCINKKRDPLNALAIELFKTATVRFTHNYVLAEYSALAHVRGLPPPESIAFLESLLTTPEVRLVWIDSKIHEKAVGLLKSRLDKTYSLCDAVSFILMRQYSISDALTTDHHFEQEGFHRLLK